MTAVRYHISHVTAYHYDTPVFVCHNEFHLIPRTDVGQQLIKTVVNITPKPRYRYDRKDFFGNPVSFITIEQAHQQLQLVVESSLDKEPRPTPDTWGKLAWEQAVLKHRPDSIGDTHILRQFCLASPFIPALAELKTYASQFFHPQRSLYESVCALVQAIYEQFTYKPGFTTVSTPLACVLENRHGVCQDFAHVAIGCLRAMGIAARYVSGYLETQPPPGQPKLQGADASHAWFAVFDPNVGWLDFDPTNNVIPSAHHLTLAWGRDYSDVTPLKGVVFGGGEHRLYVSVDVARQDND